MKTAVTTAAVVYGLAFVMSMLVALLIKAIYVVVRRLNRSSQD